jgi:hypothetical protein
LAASGEAAAPAAPWLIDDFEPSAVFAAVAELEQQLAQLVSVFQT